MTADDLLRTLHTTPTDLTTPFLTVYDLDLDQTPPRTILEANLPYSYTQGFDTSPVSRSDGGGTLLQGIASVRFERNIQPNAVDLRSDYAIKLEAANQLVALSGAFLARLREVNELQPGFPLYGKFADNGDIRILTLGSRIFKDLNLRYKVWR